MGEPKNYKKKELWCMADENILNFHTDNELEYFQVIEIIESEATDEQDAHDSATISDKPFIEKIEELPTSKVLKRAYNRTKKIQPTRILKPEQSNLCTPIHVDKAKELAEVLRTLSGIHGLYTKKTKAKPLMKP